MATTNVTTTPKKEVTPDEQTRAGRTYVPNVDICETEEALRLWADLPGVDESSVDVQLHDEVLTVTGRVSLGEYEGLAPVYSEGNVGNFSRRFRLSSEIDGEKIRARMTNGVLELELPKLDRVRRRRIPISA
jgi:HSP20 family molecular chaperone IbpA